MNELIEQMKTVLADSYVMYLKAHGYHWNVEGELFPMFHDFYAEIYDEVYGSIDDTAEQIRQIGGRAVHTLLELDKYRTIADRAVDTPTDTSAMTTDLFMANQLMLTSLLKAFQMAESNNEEGLSNYLQDRITSHKKLAWKLRSTLNKAGE